MITYLLQEAKTYAMIRLLFLNQEFFDVESLSTLKGLSTWFVIPAKRTPAVKKIVLSAHRESQPVPGREEYALITSYTMTKEKHSVTVPLVVILYPSKKAGESWDEFAYVTNIPVTLENALVLAERYRKRWGNETGYRVKDEVRGKTCSPNYALRFLFQMLSILMYNLWHLYNLLPIIRLNWKNKGYPMILNKFRDNHCRPHHRSITGYGLAVAIANFSLSDRRRGCLNTPDGKTTKKKYTTISTTKYPSLDYPLTCRTTVHTSAHIKQSKGNISVSTSFNFFFFFLKSCLI